MPKLTPEKLAEILSKALSDDEEPSAPEETGNIWEKPDGSWGVDGLKGPRLTRWLEGKGLTLADDEEIGEITESDDSKPPKLKAADEPRRFGGRRVS